MSQRGRGQTHLQTADPGVSLAVVVGRGERGQVVGGDAARVPVGPVDAVGFHEHVHGVDADVGVALEGKLVAPDGHPRVQTADLVVVADVEHLSRSCEWEEGSDLRNILSPSLSALFYFIYIFYIIW